MESRIRKLESEMDAESRRYADAQKNMRKSERRVKEVGYAQEEEKKNQSMGCRNSTGSQDLKRPRSIDKADDLDRPACHQ